jgi:mycoredoxin
MSQIIVYGTRWCGDTKRALKILDERQVIYEWINIDKNKQGEEFVIKTNNGFRSVPTIIFPDGSIMVEPGNVELNAKLDSLYE